MGGSRSVTSSFTCSGRPAASATRRSIRARYLRSTPPFTYPEGASNINSSPSNPLALMPENQLANAGGGSSSASRSLARFQISCAMSAIAN